jgi:tetratricopeptide (TPR) repeat protein
MKHHTCQRLPRIGIKFLAALLLTCSFFSHRSLAQSESNLLGTLIIESVVPGTDKSSGVKDGDKEGNGNPVNTGSAKTSESEMSAQAVEQYRSSIEGSIRQGDIYSQELAQQYEAYGISLFRLGDYENAVAAFEDAIHIHKVNKGLFNLDQARVIGHLIDIYTQLGDFPSVDNFKHYQYYIQVKNLDENDPRLILAKNEWADWNIEAYSKGYRDIYLSPLSFQDSANLARRSTNNQVRIPFRVEMPNMQDNNQGGDTNRSVGGTIVANMPLLNSNAVATNMAVTEYNLQSIPVALASDMIVNRRLHDAENIYRDLLEKVKNSSPDNLLEQQQLQKKIANVNFLLKQELKMYEKIDDQGSIAYNRVNQEYTSDATMMAERRYVQTKNEYEALVNKINDSQSVSAIDKADAYISLGDMHLSFERPRRAFDSYHKAYNILAESGINGIEAANMITPKADIPVPGYGIHRFSRNFFNISEDVDIPYKGYIDVSFSKDRFGKANAINVVDESDSTPGVIRNTLMEHLRDQTFRPEIENVQSIIRDNIELRYYYFY